MDYRREIDGLRALAVLPVILFHAGFQTFSGGFVGVDIFFVISGYLITSIILAEKQAGTFTLINFYERRARRILPALFVVMFTCLPFAWLWLLPPADMKNFSQSLVAVSSFSSNILFWQTSNYFETAAELKPLLHTWSLAVEEQFYLFFPIFLMLIWRLGKHRILIILTVLLIASLSVAQWGSIYKPVATFYLLPTRGWELLIGAFVAFYFSNSYKPNFSILMNQAGSIIGLLLINYAIFVFDKHTPFPSLYTLVPVIGTAFIILFATQQTFAGKLLGNKLLVGIGLISYSAYLWHQPLLAFAKHKSIEEPSDLLLTMLAAAAIALAYFSWKYVETPFRNKQRFSRKQIFTYSAVGSSLFVTIGLVGHFDEGFESRFTNSQLDILSYTSYAYEDLYRKGTCLLEPEQTYQAFTENCESKNNANAAMIWGDSHAAALSFGLRQHFTDVIQYNASGCPPLKDVIINWRPHCKDANDFVLSKLKRLTPKKIFLHANWKLYKEEELATNIQKTIQYLQVILPATEIIIIGSVPQWPISLPMFMAKKHVNLNEELYLNISAFDELSAVDRLLDNVASHTNVKFLSALDVLCEAEKCKAITTYQQQLTLTAWDYGHLTESGSVLLAEQLLTR